MHFRTFFLTLLFVFFGQPHAFASDYFIISSNEQKPQTSTFLMQIFVSSLEDELSQTGFNVVQKRAQVFDDTKALKIIPSLQNMDDGKVLPNIELLELASGRKILSIRSKDLLDTNTSKAEYILEAENVASVLVRQAIHRLYSQNWANINDENFLWETEASKFKLRFFSFDSCYLNYVADVIETEFPGTISLSLSRNSKNVGHFLLITKAKTRFLTKWLSTLFKEEGLSLQKDYRIEVNQRFIDVRLKPNSLTYSSFC